MNCDRSSWLARTPRSPRAGVAGLALLCVGACGLDPVDDNEASTDSDPQADTDPVPDTGAASDGVGSDDTGASACAHVGMWDSGELYFEWTQVAFDVSLIGPLEEIDEYPSGTYSALGNIADGLAQREPGTYRIRFAEFGEIDPDGTERDGWFIQYEYLVDEPGEIWRLYKEGVLPPNSSELKSASAAERLDAAAVADLSSACTSVYAQLRARCVHDIVVAAPAVATCGEPDAGLE
jgi:hypothetical protein